MEEREELGRALRGVVSREIEEEVTGPSRTRKGCYEQRSTREACFQGDTDN